MHQAVQHKAAGVQRETPKGSGGSYSRNDPAANKRARDGNCLLNSRRTDASLFKAARIESAVIDEGARKKLNFKTRKLTK